MIVGVLGWMIQLIAGGEHGGWVGAVYLLVELSLAIPSLSPEQV
jgi:hypothetical protein